MVDGTKTREELLLEVDGLRRQLAEAQEALASREAATPVQHQTNGEERQHPVETPEAKLYCSPKAMAQPDSPIKILLIEDNPGDARLIREMLANTGVQGIAIEWVPRLSQGLESLSKGKIDLVLLDLSLPDSRGLETFCTAYFHSPEIPFLILTGLDDETLALTAMQEGAQDYLIKGETNGHKLLRAIRYAAERKKVQEALRRARDELEQRVQERTAELVVANREMQEGIAHHRQTEMEQQRLLAEVQNYSEELRISNEELKIQGVQLRAQHETLNAQAEELEALTGDLEAGRNLLLAVLEQMPAGVIIAEAAGRIIMTNRQAETILRQPPGSLSDLEKFRQIQRYYPDGRLCPGDALPLWRALTLGETMVDEEYLLQQDAGDLLQAVHLNISATPVRDQHGAVIAAVATYTDITARQQTQAALRQSEERYRSLVELSPEAIVVHARGKIVFVNQAAVKLFGADVRSDLVGQPVMDRIHPDYHGTIQDRIRRIRGGATVGLLEHKVLRLDGKAVEVEGIGSGIMFEGRPAVHTLLRDITERKRAREALREASEKIRAMIEASPLAILHVNQQGIIQRVNPATERIFGWGTEELLGRPLPMVPEDQWEEVRSIIGRVWQGEQLTGIEARRRRKDGVWIDVSLSVAPMYDENGKVTGVVSLAEDITARKQAEAALAKSRAEFEAIFHSIPDAIIFADPERHIVLANPAVKAIFGYEPEELIGRSAEVLYADQADYEAVRTSYYAGGRPKKPTLFEITYRRKNRTLFSAESLASPVRDVQGNILGGVGIHRDITARKVAEAALKESQRQVTMLADFLENSSQPFGVGYLDGRIGMFNEAFLQLLGYSQKELSRLNWAKDLTPPEWRKVDAAKVEELRRTGLPVRYEKEYWRKDRTRVPVEVFVHLRRDEQGQPLHFYAFVTDITARKAAEAALQESEARFRAIFEGAAIGIALTGTAGQILAINPALEKSLGYCLPDLAGKTFADITHVDDVKESQYFFEELMAGRREHYHLEKRYICKDGSLMWINLTVSLIRDAAGAPKYAVGMVEDITARKEAEEALRQAKHEWERTFDTVPDLIVILDNQHRIVQVNRATAEVLGMKPTDLVGRTCYEILHHTSEPPAFCPHTQMMTEGREQTLEMHLFDRDFMVSVTPLVDAQGIITGSVHVARDITERKQAEAALERERQRLFALLDELPGFIFLHGEDSAVWFANRRCREIFGDPQDGFCYMVFHHRETPCEGCPADTVFATQTSVEWEQTLPDGRTFQIYKYPFRDIDDAPCILSLGLDITVRKQAEDALRKQAELLDLAHDAIVVRDLEGRVTFWNRGAEETYGWTERQAKGQISHILLKTVFPVPRENFEREVLEAGKWQGELQQTCATGEVIVAASRWALQRDDRGKPTAILEINRDITDQKLAEEALRESEGRFRQLAENLDDVILLASADLRRVHYISPAYERIWGRSCASLYNEPRSWIESVVPADRVKVRFALKELIVGDRPADPFPEFRINRPDGVGRWILARFFPIKNEAGKVYRIAGIATDITQRKEVETVLKWREEHLRQTAKMEAVGRLAGGVAHDFNNLLTVISGYGELLLADLQEADQQRQQVQAILKAADQATAVTHQLLAFSRKQVLQPQLLELNGLITGLVEMFSRLVDENIKISMNLEPNLGAVKADPSHIEQVVMNLAINALDAMPQGGALTIETANVQVVPDDTRRHPEVGPGSYVMIKVSDTGIGMNREILSHIFEPFFTTKERGKGTGLGLSMAYGIIKQSGGHILVESAPQRGTSFRIYLPRVILPQEPAKLAISVPGDAMETGTILLVEDETGVRHVVRRMLTLKGYSVLTAHDGQEALKIGQSHPGPIHLLLTDVAMPVMGGRELAERLTPSHPEMKVLFMSGHTEDGVLQRGVRESLINFIQKPFRTEQLLDKVRKLLAGPKP